MATPKRYKTAKEFTPPKKTIEKLNHNNKHVHIEENQNDDLFAEKETICLRFDLVKEEIR